MGLGRQRTRLPAELSYGDMRRLGLAVALANHPRLLLADEVTAGLDDDAADQLLADLDGLLRELDARAIVVAHGRHLPRQVDRIVPLPYPRLVTSPVWAGRDTVIGSLYVQKAMVGDPPPAQLRVTIEANPGTTA